MPMKFNELYRDIRALVKDSSLSEKIITLIDKRRSEEKQLRHSKQREGIARAREAGIKSGRRPTPKPSNFRQVMDLYFQDSITVSEAAEMLKVSRGVFYRWLCIERDKQAQLDMAKLQ